MLKNLIKVILLTCGMSSVLAGSNQYKQIDYHTVKSNGSVEVWEIQPPYNGYGFGQWPDDHRIQKILVHVNDKLSGSGERSGSVRFNCNGTAFTINAGETVICERSLDNYAGLEIILDRKHENPSSQGTVRFIMQDLS